MKKKDLKPVTNKLYRIPYTICKNCGKTRFNPDKCRHCGDVKK